MNRRVKQLIKKFALFIVLFILRHLAGVLGMAGMSIRIIQRRAGEFMNAGKEGAEV